VADNLDDILASLQDAVDRRRFGKADFFEPYDKQREFFAAGVWFRERLLMAGNQLGKTEAGAYETSVHLTGRYPFWWQGRRWDRAVSGWAAGESSVVVRDVQQNKLCGSPGVDDDFGTGYIAKKDFADKPAASRGVADAFDNIQVWHHKWDEAKKEYVRDGISTLHFKSYEQGRTKFQGATIDFGWLDEEPAISIYSEVLTRVTATLGMIFMTFTPLKGMSNVVMRFLNEKSEDRSVVTMVIEDAKHIPASERQRIIAGYPDFERDARARGIPMLGSGRIFPVADDTIIEDPVSYIPRHWTKLWSIDFGIGHPFAAVLSLWDKDNDVIHIHHAFRMKDALPIQHAAAMKPIGAAVPVAWPHDGDDREKTTGKTVAIAYRREGLKMCPQRAQWEDGGISTEAGIMEMHDRMITGRFKVARQLMNGVWGEEFRMYHRADGKIVKVMDDIMSATRIGIMAKRYGRTVNLGSKVPDRGQQQIAEGVDFDLFGG